ncbi:DMT family transporter [Paenisporosarcina indica]|uniref:DMT family transporter n=1 Tax=Paenisporosarcina indica TaxID=650093 RepID=UPI00094F79D6|nr:DMT family transporter [Paenisporosarcina indica]
MKQWKIYGILVFVMFLWGFNLPAVKFLVSEVGPVTTSAFRIFLASVVVFSILAVLKMVRKPTKQEWKYIVLGAFLNVVCHHYFLSLGLTMTTSSNAGLILGTGPVLTAVLVSLFMKNYPTRLQWFGAVLGLIGVSATVLAAGDGTSGISLGDVLVFLSIFTQVFSYLVISKAASAIDPRLLTAYMFLVGSAILFVISLIQEPGEIKVLINVPPIFWIAFIGSAVFGTAVGHMLYNYSIGKAGPSKAAIFMNLNTLFTLIGSSIFLNEKITQQHILGLVLIVTGVLFGSGAVEDIWNKYKTKKSVSE